MEMVCILYLFVYNSFSKAGFGTLPVGGLPALHRACSLGASL